MAQPPTPREEDIAAPPRHQVDGGRTAATGIPPDPAAAVRGTEDKIAPGPPPPPAGAAVPQPGEPPVLPPVSPPVSPVLLGVVVLVLLVAAIFLGFAVSG